MYKYIATVIYNINSSLKQYLKVEIVLDEVAKFAKLIEIVTDIFG